MMKNQIITLMIGAAIFAANPAFAMNEEHGRDTENNLHKLAQSTPKSTSYPEHAKETEHWKKFWEKEIGSGSGNIGYGFHSSKNQRANQYVRGGVEEMNTEEKMHIKVTPPARCQWNQSESEKKCPYYVREIDEILNYLPYTTHRI